MFSVVTVDSWTKVKRKLISLALTRHHVSASDQRPVEIKNIIGTKARSTQGCQFCKKRRRKCDEKRPTCGLCVKKGVECVYDVGRLVRKRFGCTGLGNGRRNGGRNGGRNGPFDTDLGTDLDSIIDPSTVMVYKETFQDSRDSGDTLECIIPGFTSTISNLSHKSSLKSPNSDGNSIYTLYQQPSPQLSLFLDDNGRFYVHYFETHVSNLLCMNLTNYFRKLFCALAYHEEAFALAIAAWGAFYQKLNTIDNEVSTYLYSSVTKFAENFEFDDNKISLYFKICYYLILVGFNICTGDTHNWHQFMRECFDVINQLGGIESLAKEFNFSDEVRFLVSNFQYHDIMSSLSNKQGTCIPMSRYDNLYNHVGFLDKEANYGIDTLQGCNNPILTILGYVLELKSRLDNGDVVSNEEIGDMEARIHSCVPKQHLIQQLDALERQDHLKTFELYRLCCQLTMELYVKRNNPQNQIVQQLRIQTLELIQSLACTKFRVIVCLPLLLCGICSYQDECRNELQEIYQNIMQTCPVPNVGKCWTIVQTSWQRNPTGELIIDWTSICHEFGWRLNSRRALR